MDAMYNLRPVAQSRPVAQPQPAGGPPPSTEATGRASAGLFSLLLIAGMVACGFLIPPGWNFIGIFVLMFVFMLLLGVLISKRPMGILINQRNLMSLSRFQMALWTLVILSAFLAIGLERIKNNNPPNYNPLDIALDPNLWALMGISTASLVGSPLILSTKQNKDPDPSVLPRVALSLKEPAVEINNNRQGTLYANKGIVDARFTDMFEGDELSNTDHIDLAKVQMFFFTIVTVVGYAAGLFQTICATQPANLNKFPGLSPGFVALLGISHAGYLTSKSVDHTPTD